MPPANISNLTRETWFQHSAECEPSILFGLNNCFRGFAIGERSPPIASIFLPSQLSQRAASLPRLPNPELYSTVRACRLPSEPGCVVDIHRTPRQTSSSSLTQKAQRGVLGCLASMVCRLGNEQLNSSSLRPSVQKVTQLEKMPLLPVVLT